MLPGLSLVYAFLTTSAEIWKTLKTKYSQKGNYLKIFRLKKKIQKLEQGTMTMDTYFAELNTLWQELDVYEDLYEGFDAATVTKLQTKSYKFLMGLNSEFDVVVQTTLQKEPFPSLEEAFSAVNQESGQKDEKQSPIIKRSVLVSSNVAPRNYERPIAKCDHCGKLYHTKETCWKIIG
ncbi:UBN2_3 domain-containing protein [Cephalotus follicularis]|uniref:UBN2_3 domain-containing protein n=1 Tax=Cephalotus follicularis TaxID=3775 RepID=A0A1Q3D7V7_CEPFO|nr:UBN2_3 domain-containing protein [Cephalotus follicularis]